VTLHVQNGSGNLVFSRAALVNAVSKEEVGCSEAAEEEGWPSGLHCKASIEKGGNVGCCHRVHAWRVDMSLNTGIVQKHLAI
jgi:hypothetical protein